MDFNTLFILLRPVFREDLKKLLDCRIPHEGLTNDQKRKAKKAVAEANAEWFGRKSTTKPRRKKDTI